MESILKDKLEGFRNVSNEIIQYLENEDFDNLENLFRAKAEFINAINKLVYDVNEFRNIAEELQLMELEQKINELLNEKKLKVRSEMDRVSTVKKANNNYQRSFHPDSLYFNKKI